MLNWFSKKTPATQPASSDHAGHRHGDPKTPLSSSDKHQGTGTPGSGSPQVTRRKAERLERRELLYSVVRDTMIRAGVLGASYKFKVLAVDTRGDQFLIMMDLVDQLAGHAGRLTEIEAMIAQAAKVRHDILVTAVYWRVSEHAKAPPLRNSPASAPQSPKPLPVQQAPLSSATHPPPPKQSPRYEPLQPDEVEAFKRALASAAPVAPLSAVGQIVTSGRRNPAPADEFADTQMVDSEDRPPPLSSTQYGDLN